MVELALPAAIFFTAAFIQGLAGFGSGLIAMALLPLVWDLHTAVAVAAIFNLALNISMAWHLRRHVELSEVTPMMAAAFVGVPLGVWFLHNLEVSAVTTGLGVVLVLYTLWSLFGKTANAHSPSRGLAALTGFAGGALAGAINVAGPPVLVYATLRRWHRDAFRANLQCYFAVTCGLAVTGYSVTGLVTAETLSSNAVLAPALILGVVLGDRLCQRVDQQRFRTGVLIGLLAIGGYYLARPLLS